MVPSLKMVGTVVLIDLDFLSAVPIMGLNALLNGLEFVERRSSSWRSFNCLAKNGKFYGDERTNPASLKDLDSKSGNSARSKSTPLSNFKGNQPCSVG